ncbi:MAG TPA: hypothetical protein VLL52_18435 [Anaerolineae bacterium]|nr:hypothetical protein [Anaerolineae bacterium]
MNNQTTPYTLFQHAPRVTLETVAHETILRHADTGVYTTLDDLGQQLWSQLDGHTPLNDIAINIATSQNRKVANLITAMRHLATTPSGTHAALHQLAEEYNVEYQFITTHLHQLGGPHGDDYATGLLSEFAVTDNEILGQIITLAQNLAQDNWIIPVK